MSASATQKRLLTQPSSKLAKSNIITLLRKEDAWNLLAEETRAHLYSLLPPPVDGEPAHDPDVHPLKSLYKPYIEEELRRYQEDLKEGREQKKWREEAMQAARDRLEGKFDEGVKALREEYWSGCSKEEKVVEGKVEGDGKVIEVGGDSREEIKEDVDGGGKRDGEVKDSEVEEIVVRKAEGNIQ